MSATILQQQLTLPPRLASEGADIQLKGQQYQAAVRMAHWMSLDNPKNPFLRLQGLAGSGKTTMLAKAVDMVRSNGGPYDPLEMFFDTRAQANAYAETFSGEGYVQINVRDPRGSFRAGRDTPSIIACGPTVRARDEVRLRDPHNRTFDSIETIHSILSLVPQKWKTSDQDRLMDLLDSEPRSAYEQKEFEQLLLAKKAHMNREPVFAPKNREFANLRNVGLLVVDEASMINKLIYLYLCSLVDGTLLDCENVRPDLRILAVMDDMQLPPVKERRSRCCFLPALAKLTEVVRQTGPLLDFCLDVRNAKYDYKEVHLEHYGRSEAVQILSFNEALLKTADRINRGEDAVVIVGTNARVAQVNALIRYILKGDGKITLEVGDQMISHGVLSRGKNGECNAFGEQPFFPTRKKMRITSIIGEDTYTNPWTGNTFRVFEVTAEELSGVDIGTTIKIVDPDQFLAWQEERKAQREKVFLQTLSTTANSPRGKMGDGAKAIWQRVFYQNNPEICMASWEFWSKPGQPTHKDKKNRITRSQYDRIVAQLEEYADALDGIADPVTFSFAVTTHSIQGATVAYPCIDMETVCPPQTPAWLQPSLEPTELQELEPEDDFVDPVHLLYHTAVTRASEGIILAVPNGQMGLFR
jgi:hypothetical protein